MPTITVSDGGANATLSAGHAAATAGDTISIEGTWSVADTTAVTISKNNITIITDASSKHPGYVTNTNHYRLITTTGTAITVTGTGCTIDGIVVQLNSGGDSDEGIRVANTGTTTIQNSIIWTDDNFDNQDGIYSAAAGGTINVINNILYGWYRGCCHTQASTAQTWNINSNTMLHSGDTVGACVLGNSGTAHNINIFNSILLLDPTDGAGLSVDETGSSINWQIDYCIGDDTSMGIEDSGAVGLIESTTIDDGTPGSAKVWVTDVLGITTYDLHLTDDDTNNQAMGVYREDTYEPDREAASGAGLSIPATDMLGNTRSAPYDCGALVVAAGGTSLPIIRNYYRQQQQE